MTAVRDREAPPAGGALSALAHPISYRGDIEGLRAVAVLLVLVDHAGLPLTGGFIGVDVFFVISGYLITSLLLAELVEKRGISLRSFYARRARRLLPAAATVLLVTALLTVLLIPRTRWLDIAYDIGASAIYVENWRLAELAVDYQAQDSTASPLQHFWSLAVEEQFYIVWPLLLVAVAALLRTRWLGYVPRTTLAAAPGGVQRRVLVALAVAIGVVGVPSLAWSVWFTADNPFAAYFVTTTRLWELAVGGATALLAGVVARRSPATMAVVGWAGLGAIAVSAVLYTSSTPFPGVAALVPVLGTAAVLAAGASAAAPGPRRVLDVGPMRWVGTLSYSLYLWHWPLIIVAAAVVGERTVLLGTVAVVLSFVPAYLSYRYVEDPIRRSRPLRRDPEKSLAVGLTATAAAMMAAVAMIVGVGTTPTTASAVPLTLDAAGDVDRDQPRIGALVLADDPRDDPAGAPTDTVPSITPDPVGAKNDIGPGWCSTAILETEVRTCALGDTSSPTEVALIGDSHAQQWTTPLSTIARQRHWRLTGYTKSGCPFVSQDVAISSDAAGGTTPGGRTYRECAVWRDQVVQRLTTGPNPPKMIIVSSGEHFPMVGGEIVRGARATDLLVRGFREAWAPFQARGTRVVVIGDTPAPDLEVPDCVAENRDRLTECTFSRAEANTVDGAAIVEAGRAQRDVTVIDMSDALCPTERCAPVIGGVLVWRDISHMSASYAATLAPRLNRLLPPLP
ncbi:acyltransferase family protein [Actinomycetospora aeridis]|uniref:Acyltransferase family protein n=1 Tax=Actinomycetospora aeridis TaxID=3129231 RepID=A0ABU8N926_9PSEU